MVGQVKYQVCWKTGDLFDRVTHIDFTRTFDQNSYNSTENALSYATRHFETLKNTEFVFDLRLERVVIERFMSC